MQDSDSVAIVTGHRNVDYQHVVDLAASMMDCCNVTAGVKGAGEKVVKLGVGSRKDGLRERGNGRGIG